MKAVSSIIIFRGLLSENQTCMQRFYHSAQPIRFNATTIVMLEFAISLTIFHMLRVLKGLYVNFVAK